MKGFKPASMLMMLTALVVGFIPAMQTAYADGTSQLTVSSQLDDGGELEGMFTELLFGSQTIATSFTPSTYILNDGEEYQIGVADYDIYFFTYWLDTGSVDRWRTIAITEDTELVAIYRIQEETEEIQTTSTQNPSSNSNRAYVESLVEKLQVYKGDNANVPDINLSGYALPSGAYFSEYERLYDIMSSGVDITNVMKAVQLAGLDWHGMSDAQKCYLSLILNSDISLDEDGLPAA